MVGTDVGPETVRVSGRGRGQLITLKRRTGVEHWNTLCRWAFCVSMAEPRPPLASGTEVAGDRQIEMTWRTFAGEFSEVYLALLTHRCRADGIEVNRVNVSGLLRRHLVRGISYLVANPKLIGISGFIRLAVGEDVG